MEPPGAIVNDPATFNQLLAQCTTVWPQATPEDPLSRVADEGDLRPVPASAAAMDYLKHTLAGRAAVLAKAQLHAGTRAQPLDETLVILRRLAREALNLPA